VLLPGQPFRNSILGGNGTLVRPQMRSPNYVPGVSGWIIRRDGSVEFNNGTFRGVITNAGIFVYLGAPAFGTLKVVLSPTPGTDAFGNIYGPGLSFPADDGTNKFSTISQADIAGVQTFEIEGPGVAPGTLTTISMLDTGRVVITTQENMVIAATGDMDVVANGPNGIQLDSNTFINADFEVNGNSRFQGSTFTIIGGNTMQFSAGAAGGYYFEQRSLSGIAVANNVGVTLTPGASQKLRSDYGSKWAGNTWTCPVDGEYDWTLALGGIGACTRCFARVNVNGAANPSLWDDTAITGTGKQISGCLEMVAGDTVQVSAFQNTGAGINLSALSFVSVGRRL
jgi:hypothetical protein